MRGLLFLASLLPTLQGTPELRRYADRVSRIADVAYEKASFYDWERLGAQLAMVYGGKPSPGAIPFDSLAKLARDYSRELKRINGDFDAAKVPSDVERVHAQITEAFNQLGRVVDSLAIAATVCSRTFDVVGCRGPFSRASNGFLAAQVSYLDARRRTAAILKEAGVALPPLIPRPMIRPAIPPVDASR